MNLILETRVQGVNEANRYAKQLYLSLAPIFTPLVGQKVEKADGSLLKKIELMIPTLPNGINGSLQVYRNNSRHSLSWVVRTCRQSMGRTFYHEVAVYIANTKDGVIVLLCTPPDHLRDNYIVAEVEAARAEYETAKAALQAAESKLHPFGAFDR